MSNSIVPVNLVVKSLRDNGYKNTAYAIAELIDNSIQHGSSQVDLICLEKDILIGTNYMSRINEIGVLDNGTGMNKEILWQSLQFGNGTNLEVSAQTSIGKFGMGLPSSSISQAIKVEVWTWQGDISKALYSYLDVNEISKGQMTDVPEPILNSIPEKWIKISNCKSKSGTLVVWSSLDRCLWKTGKTIISHSEYIVGRMYRKFINSGQCIINSIVANENNLDKIDIKPFLANDPLYLMQNTSISEVLKKEGINDPMFVKHGGDDGYEKEYNIDFNGKKHKVYVRYSVATEETRKGLSAGGRAHGKHAKGNIGVSVVRAGRELDLDSNWTTGYDPRERWWGVEIEFPPSLDEVFGVTNNKQYANNFRELGELDITTMLFELGQTIHEYKEELALENDPKVYIIEIAIDIKNQIKSLMDVIKAQASRLEKPEPSTRHAEEKEAEKKATDITQARSEDGHLGESEKKAQGKSDEEKLDEIKSELISDNVPEANVYAEEIFNSNFKFQFVDAKSEGKAFFSVSPVGGKILIKLNTSHAAYSQFVEVLNDTIDENSDDNEIASRLQKAQNGMKLLLMAWARYEDEQPDGRLKEVVKDARNDWGKMAAEFMRNED